MEEKQEKQKNSVQKTAVLVALILGLSIVIYGYMSISHKNKVFEAEQAEKERALGVGQAEKERALKTEQATEAEQERKNKLNEAIRDICYKEIQKQYKSTWNLNCKNRGLKESCSLPLALAERLKDNMEKDIDNCLKRYLVE